MSQIWHILHESRVCAHDITETDRLPFFRFQDPGLWWWQADGKFRYSHFYRILHHWRSAGYWKGSRWYSSAGIHGFPYFPDGGGIKRHFPDRNIVWSRHCPHTDRCRGKNPSDGVRQNHKWYQDRRGLYFSRYPLRWWQWQSLPGHWAVLKGGACCQAQIPEERGKRGSRRTVFRRTRDTVCYQTDWCVRGYALTAFLNTFRYQIQFSWFHSSINLVLRVTRRENRSFTLFWYSIL